MIQKKKLMFILYRLPNAELNKKRRERQVRRRGGNKAARKRKKQKKKKDYAYCWAKNI